MGWPGGLEPHPAHHIEEGSRREAVARAEVGLPDLKWAFFLSLGVFPLGFYSVYTSDQYPLNPSVWLHWGHRSTLRSFSVGGALILFYSQARVLAQTLGCDWCRSAVTCRKCSFRSHCPGICLGWRTCGPWKKPVSCVKDKGLHTCTGETNETRPAGHGRATWYSLWPQQQGPEGQPPMWTVGLLDLGNKVMFANSLLPWLGSEIWNSHPSWESLKTWNAHVPVGSWLMRAERIPVIWSL